MQATNSINRVTLVGYLDDHPYTLGDKTTHAQTILRVTTRDFSEEPIGNNCILHRRHTVVVTDFMAREYIDLHLKKRDGVFVEGQLDYVHYGVIEIVITPSYGHIRRLGEPRVTELEQEFVK
ncbi:MAG: hypothetical protein ABFQ95_02670 [Pseudomonadota bacterium]